MSPFFANEREILIITLSFIETISSEKLGSSDEFKHLVAHVNPFDSKALRTGEYYQR